MIKLHSFAHSLAFPDLFTYFVFVGVVVIKDGAFVGESIDLNRFRITNDSENESDIWRV